MIYKLKFFFESVERFFGNLYQSILSVVKVVVLSRASVKLPAPATQECVILGNGPSLKEVLNNHKDFLFSRDLFCVNMFTESPEFVELQPRYLVWLDTGFYMYKNREEMAKDRPQFLKAVDALIEHTRWPLTLFLPVLAKNSFLKEIEKTNPNITICYFNYTIVKGFPAFERFFFRRNLGMPLCQNVLGATIFLSLNAGYKKIYLTGADHTWMQNIIVGEDNNLMMKLSNFHFYSDPGKPSVTPMYKSPLTREKLRISDFFMICVKTFSVYYILEDYARSLGAEIINATPDSFIDAFTRKRLE